MSIDKGIIALLLVVAHMPIVYSIAKIMHAGKYPRVVDFGALGIVLYFDLGLIIEFLGLEFANPLLPSFYAVGSDWQQILIVLIVLATPYLYYLGTRLIDPEHELVKQIPSSKLMRSRRFPFYTVTLGTTVIMAGWSLNFYIEDPLAVRARFRELALPLNLVLLMPMHLLAFYVRQKDATTRSGIFITLILLVASVAAVLPISSRTALLLPLLIVMLFSVKISPVKLMGVFLIGLVLAIALLPLYTNPTRWGRVTEPETIEWKSQLQHVLFQDFYRAHVTTEVVERARLLDTDVMPYPMSGYVYSALYFVPRSIAPFKGRSTAIYFAADYLGYDLNDSKIFGFGNSAIDEIILNAGILFLVPGLLLYGIAMGLLDRLSRQIPALLVPTRLAALWSGGYVLSVIVHLFGSMLLVCLAFHWLFARKLTTEES